MSKAVERTTLQRVLPHYHCSLNNSTVAPLGNGLINSTFLVRSINTNFVLQKINQHVFPKPGDVVNNAELINNHLLNKQTQGQYQLTPMRQIENNDNKVFSLVDRNYWRAIEYIPNCYTIEAVDTPEQAQQVAAAFAKFTHALADFPAQELAVIIPSFHHLGHRLSQLKTAAKSNTNDRLQHCSELLEFCLSEHEFIKSVAELEASLPLRVTHNDTKINNLLFCASNNNPTAVIDLDTCMPGFIMHDFGDMVRTCCSNLPEDGKNIEEMYVREDILSALAKGYLSELDNHINELEKQSLVIGAQLLPFMIGIRFLTDFIDGDNYFHTKYEMHNLDRAKNQIKLYSLLKNIQPKIHDMIYQLSR
ncbi:phosphotransferase enzyme family protein [Thalassotalea profundi]|nr:aminoglycoside phosphotransferase family protein [Thalassotalea profundi]